MGVLNLVDWGLDAAALTLSFAVAIYYVELSRRDIAIFIACSCIYISHEVWESGIVGGMSHKAFEQWLVNLLV